jgi:hypothetical protein
MHVAQDSENTTLPLRVHEMNEDYFLVAWGFVKL